MSEQVVKEKQEIQDSIQETMAKSQIETDFEESVYCASVVEESVSRSDNGLEEYTLSLELPTDKVTDFTFGEDDIAGGELEEFLEPFGFFDY